MVRAPAGFELQTYSSSGSSALSQLARSPARPRPKGTRYFFITGIRGIFVHFFNFLVRFQGSNGQTDSLITEETQNWCSLRNSTQTSENNKIELRGALNRVVEDMIARQGTVSDVCSNATLPSASFLTFSYIFELITGSDVHEQQISSLHNN
jgi:hypothetical protein